MGGSGSAGLGAVSFGISEGALLLAVLVVAGCVRFGLMRDRGPRS